MHVVTVATPAGPRAVAVAAGGGAARVAERALAAVGHPDPAAAVAAGAWTLTPPPCARGLPTFLAVAPAAPLRGGKGGFGSLLRAQGRVAKTTNFDACRDLSGRRIRQVKAEAALAEWQEREQERALEAVAEKHLRETAKAAKKAAAAAAAADAVDGDAVRAEQEAAAAAAAAAVADSLKRKPEEKAGPSTAAAGAAPDAKQKKKVAATLDALVGLSDGSDDDSESESE